MFPDVPGGVGRNPVLTEMVFAILVNESAISDYLTSAGYQKHFILGSESCWRTDGVPQLLLVIGEFISDQRQPAGLNT